MADEILLNEAAFAVWQTVTERGPIDLSDVVKLTGIDQAQVSAAATEAAQQGFIEIVEREQEELVVADKANELIQAGLPEHKAAAMLENAGGRMPMASFAEWAKQENIAVNDAIKWGTARDWLERVKGEKGAEIALTEAGRRRKQVDDDLVAIERAKSNSPLLLEDLTDDEFAKRVRKLLGNRPELARIKKRTQRTAAMTDKGADALQSRVRKDRRAQHPHAR